MDEEDHVLRPFDAAEAIPVGVAAKIARRSKRTIHDWVVTYGIGRKVVGRVEISAPALAMLLDGDQAALAAYRRGDRTSERVAKYFERAGVKPAQNAQKKRDAS